MTDPSGSDSPREPVGGARGSAAHDAACDRDAERRKIAFLLDEDAVPATAG